MIEVPHDTTRAVVNLLLSGTLAKFRDIRWLFSHAGGTIPMLAGRINFFHGNATHPAPMAALLKLIPSTQVVYGSDYPYVAMDTQVTALSQLGLDVQVLQQIQQVNANRLLARN